MRYVTVLRSLLRRSTSINYCVTSYFKTRIRPLAHILRYSTEFDHKLTITTTNDENSTNRNRQLLERLEESLSASAFDHTSWSAVSSELCERIPAFSVDEICHLFEHLSAFWCKFPYQLRNDDSLLQLAKVVDATLEKRASSWNMDQFLTIFRSFSLLPFSYPTQFRFHIVKRRLPKIFKNDNEKIIEFLHLMNKCHLWRLYYVPKFELEIFLNRNLSNLSTNELSILLKSMIEARVTTNTPNLMDRLNSKIIDDVELNNDEHTILILKFLLHQLNNYNFIGLPVVQHLAATAKNRVFDLQHLIAIAELCRETKYYDVEFFEILSRAFLQDITNVTLEQTKTVLMCLTFLDSTLKFEYVYETIIERMHETSYLNQLLQRPKVLILIVTNLCQVGVYPRDLLDIIFSNAFLRAACGKHSKNILSLKYQAVGKQLLFTDSGLALECPDYRGNRLSADISQNFVKYYCYMPALLKAKPEDNNFERIYRKSDRHIRLTYRMRSLLTEIFGSEKFIHTCYLLPYIPRLNLLFAANEQRVHQRIPAEVAERLIVEPRSLDTNLTWYTLSVQYRNKANPEEPIFFMDEITKVRHLKKLGINVVTVLSEVWKEMTADEQKNYLKSKIFSEIKE